MNNFSIEIYDNALKEYIDYTPHAVFTLKGASLLDEQLDEINITLKGVSKPVFSPQARIKVFIKTNPNSKFSSLDDVTNEFGASRYLVSRKMTCYKTLYFVLANDRAIEVPTGSGKYNHEIYAIELTKLMERYICDSLTFTNSLGKDYKNSLVLPFLNNEYPNNNDAIAPYLSRLTLDAYKTPISKYEDFTVQSLQTVANKIIPIFAEYYEYGNLTLSSIYEPSGSNIYASIVVTSGGTTTTLSTEEFGEAVLSSSFTINPPVPSTYVEIAYIIPFSFSNTSTGTTSYLLFELNYILGVSDTLKVLPLKKWTITDVINRVFDLVEPILIDVTTSEPMSEPRFRLATETASKLDQILAPEFSFTQSTLREILQLIGGFIHGEPRITREVTGENPYFEVDFDFYGSNEFSHIASKPYVSATFGVDINQYCTELDSNASNLTNTLDWAQGVIAEPYNNDGKSLRTESTTARLSEDDGTFIATSLPIREISGLYCYYIPNKGTGKWDLTPFLFESADYSLLSSYGEVYPRSKAMAIYYTIGQKNIKGLFFKAPHAVNPIFNRYSIINILREVTGDYSIDITGNEINELRFFVSYKPFYSSRVKTYKQCLLGGLGSSLVYNQSANAIETRYYGEHLKGVVERLGNVEKTYTYQLAHLCEIPKIGLKFDKDYYISSVAWELYPTTIKCTVALSKHFNRKSEYVAINSEKRMYEISEKQAISRQSVIPTYIVISNTKETPLNVVAGGGNLANARDVLFNRSGVLKPVSTAVLTLLNYNNEEIHSEYKIALPTIASSFGNAITFTYAFQDNYSAGQKVEKVESTEEEVNGYWGAYIPYTDYYGRFYYLQAELLYNDVNLNSNPLLTPQVTPPQGYTANLALRQKIKYRKDNREVPQITHEIAVVTDNQNIIIGSGLCRNCALVNQSPSGIQLYFFKNLLNAIDSNISTADGTLYNEGLTFGANQEIIVSAPVDGVIYKSFAIITEATYTPIRVIAEDGTETTQAVKTGGELVIGYNNYVKPTSLHFNLKTKIYE